MPNVNQQNMVKSVFLLNIAKFVGWPDQVHEARPAQLLLCQYQDDLLGIGFEIIRNRSINGRKIGKRTIDKLEELVDCDVLYLTETQYIKLNDKTSAADSSEFYGEGVLVVVDRTQSESEENSYSGVHVILFRRDEKIAFSVNSQEADRSQLKFDSKLVKLSTDVGLR